MMESLQAVLGQEEADHHVGGRARRRHADLLALEVGRALVVGQVLLGDAHADHRRAALQHEGAVGLALRLHGKGVLERARDHVGAAAHHGLQRLGAAGKVGDGDVQTLVLEVTARLGDGQRQVVDQGLAAHGDLDLGLLQLLGAHDGGGHAHDAGGAGHLEQITACD
jgi:hypothetical protein